MREFLFNQLKAIRSNTIDAVKKSVKAKQIQYLKGSIIMCVGTSVIFI